MPTYKKTDIRDLLLRCEASLEMASSFLLAHFDAKEGWSDFATNSSGESTSWVTAHVLWQAGGLLPDDKRNSAIEILKSQRQENGAWGFSKKIPPDCDSTLHAVHALKKYGTADEDVSDAVKYILEHQSDNGGFRTYNNKDQLAFYRKNAAPDDFIGWTNEHICVSAAALETFSEYNKLVPKVVIEKLISFLLKRQEEEGYWYSYWWRSKYFATVRIVPNLFQINDMQAKYSSEQALKWIVNTVLNRSYWDNGFDKGIPCVLSSAGCIKSLLLIGQYKELIIDVINWLISQQSVDGSWISPPILQIPQPNIIYPEKVNTWKMGGKGVGSCSSDSKKIYTTAFVAGSIKQFLLSS